MSDEKYVGPVAAAKNVLLTKAALDKKLDKTGGTITGSLKVGGIISTDMSLDLKSGIDAGGSIHSEESLLAPSLGLYNVAKETSVSIDCSGDNAARITSLSSDGKSHYSRFAVGTPTGDNDAATKAYVDSKVASGGVTVDTEMSSTSENPVQNKVVKTALDEKLDKTGGTLTGNLTGKYITGTWLQSTATSDLGRKPGRIAVLDDSGWVYYRTPSEILNDIGGASIPVPAGDGTDNGKVPIVNGTKWELKALPVYENGDEVRY